MVTRWKSYIDKGVFDLSVPADTPLGGSTVGELAEFWTGPWPYWDLQLHAPKLFDRLKESNLVIFKVRLWSVVWFFMC